MGPQSSKDCDIEVMTIPKSVKLPVVDVVFFRFLEDDFSSLPHFLAGVLATILDLLAAGVS